LTNNSNVGVSLTVGGNGQNSSYAGTLSGSGSLIKNGVGTLALSGANTYSGNTIVNVGTLKLSRDPVLKLSFDNVSGTGNGSTVTNDGTGSSSMDGTILGTGANIVGGGKFGNALSINGAGGTAKTNIVSVSNRGITTDAAGSWTVSFWIKTSTAGAVILYQGDGSWSSSGQTTFLLNANSGSTAGTRAGAVRWAGGFLTGTTALNNNAWHHITLVDNAGTESIYVDGNLDTVTSTMGLALAAGANQLWIGGAPNTDTGAVKINGMIDEVSMFNRALSLTEVRSLTNSVPGATVGSFGGQLPATTPLYVGANGIFDLGGNSQSVASLSDYGGSGGAVTNSGAAPVTLTISGSGSTTFSGAIADTASSNAVSLVKSGTSTLTLAGANSYRGATALNAGTLLVNGTLGSSPVSVANGATLGGNGSIGGTVTVQSGATLSPGTSIGELIVNNSVTLQPGSTNRMEISHTDATNDVLTVAGTLYYGGTLEIVNLSGTLGGGDSFKLFNAPNFSGSFTEMILPALDPGLIWNFVPASGVLSVVATNSTQLSAALSGNTLTLSWPADHLGWHLQVQTNALDVGLGSNWVDVPDTSTTNQVVVPADTLNGSVFYRMVYP
jgi:autotransporter-associated beta strand protein